MADSNANNLVRPPDPRPRGKMGVGVGVVVAAALLVAVVAVWRMNPRQTGDRALSDRFAYDLDDYLHVDPSLIGYEAVAELSLAETGITHPKALAATEQGTLVVVGTTEDGAGRCARLDDAGVMLGTFDVLGEPSCAAIDVYDDDPRTDGVRYLIGLGRRVALYSPQGERLAVWEAFGDKAYITAAAASPTEIFVADSGNRVVWRLDREGNILGELGRRDPEQGIVGFVIPSPYFDLAVGADGMLRVVNPGVHRIEIYTPEGDLELYWGKAATAIEGFCGCCNPANIALLPDGAVVTAEKGLPRVKVYDAHGTFKCVVAAPDYFSALPKILEETREDVRLPVIDVAADGQGRIFILDPARREIVVFQAKDNEAS
ncbi:hypothetical protein JCM19992_31040 [Thermostilla marina]